MRGLRQILNAAVRTPERRKTPRVGERPADTSFRPHLEMLEDRAVPSTVSSIVSNFNGTAIPMGDTIWFSSVFKPNGLGSAPTTIHVTDQTISFRAAGTDYTVAVPDSLITLSPTATTATTTFDAGSNTWDVVVPTKFSGNAFLGGAAFQLSSPLPGGINPVTWTGSFSSDTAGVSLNWQWAAGVYNTSFNPDYNAVSVKPLDANHGTLYANSDHAGTPEAYRNFVAGGARGGGGSNFTGSMSATGKVTPEVEVQTAPANVSGVVYFDANGDGVFDDGDTGLGGVTVTLTGTDAHNHAVNLTTTTDSTGLFKFSGILPGTYSLIEDFVPGYSHNQSDVGTVNGTTDGQAGVAQISVIGLNSGDTGVNYDFGEIQPNS